MGYKKFISPLCSINTSPLYYLHVIILHVIITHSALSIRAENNGQQVAGHDDRPNIFYPRQTPNLAGQIMKTIMFFWPKEYRIMLAIDLNYYIGCGHNWDFTLVKGFNRGKKILLY